MSRASIAVSVTVLTILCAPDVAVFLVFFNKLRSEGKSHAPLAICRFFFGFFLFLSDSETLATMDCTRDHWFSCVSASRWLSPASRSIAVSAACSAAACLVGSVDSLCSKFPILGVSRSTSGSRAPADLLPCNESVLEFWRDSSSLEELCKLKSELF